ncbi:MAG TPA: lysylphosphatidylglycerol synthase transmembrane domain-containing protein [Chloroflexaceae bacterium]|nr:lysylphosphatidylglycerol synthase transmembrane domain-containing protein [Chloroflexaceae bacterium]
MRSWKFWVGLLVSLFFLVVALRGLDLESFWSILRGANYWWLALAVPVYFVGVWLRTLRWRSMLLHLRPVPPARLFPTVVIGYMGNNVYPARMGEVLRSYVLRRNEAVAMSASLATVVLERLFDGLVMLLFIFATLPFAPLPPLFGGLLGAVSVVFLVALAVFMALAARPERLSRLYTLAVERVAPTRWRPRLHGLFDRFIVGLQSLRSPRQLFAIALVSVAIWLIETLTYWVVMLAFPFSVPFPVLMLMTAVVNLFTTIPSTPGYVGTFHAPGIAVLMQFGVAQAIATGYTVVLHATLWLPITLLGAFFMLRESIGWGDLERAAELKEGQQPAPPTAPEDERDEAASRVIP